MNNKSIFFLIIFGLSLILVYSCRRENNTVLPQLTTSTITEITETTAKSGGTIISNGGTTIIARGICWSTNLNPSIDDNKTSDDMNTETYSSSLTGLSSATTYFVSAYASNEVGTAYGDAILFVTQMGAGETVTDINGNVYHTLNIGSQKWIAENLKVANYRNGDSIPCIVDNNQWSSLLTGAYCNYNNDSENVITYGRLYNWYAVNDSRKICPAGWHIPTDAEWSTLTNYLGTGSFAGGKMKETGTTHWNSPNTGADNSSGFSGLPGAYRDAYSGDFENIKNFCNFWSATENSSTNAWARVLSSNNTAVTRGGSPKKFGYSVRCVKD